MNERIRTIAAYTGVGSTLALIVLLLSGYAPRQDRLRVEEITVERINVVDSAGRTRVLIAGGFPPRRTELAGILFINQDGIEAGGLVYTGEEKDGKVTAAGLLTFDQYRDDQILALRYVDTDGRRHQGLVVMERPDSLHPEVRRAYGVLDTLTDAGVRDSILGDLRRRLPGEMAARRLYLGRDAGKSAILTLADRAGNARLRIAVDSTGAAAIDFLDEDGGVVRRIAPDAP